LATHSSRVNGNVSSIEMQAGYVVALGNAYDTTSATPLPIGDCGANLSCTHCSEFFPVL
jgi:hypothetical protein